MAETELKFPLRVGATLRTTVVTTPSGRTRTTYQVIVQCGKGKQRAKFMLNGVRQYLMKQAAAAVPDTGATNG